METVGAYAAKTRFSELLRRVAEGQGFTITRHGVPIAKLVPANGGGQEDRGATIEALRRFRKGRKLGRTTVRQLIQEGRRC